MHRCGRCATSSDGYVNNGCVVVSMIKSNGWNSKRVFVRCGLALCAAFAAACGDSGGGPSNPMMQCPSRAPWRARWRRRLQAWPGCRPRDDDRVDGGPDDAPRGQERCEEAWWRKWQCRWRGWKRGRRSRRGRGWRSREPGRRRRQRGRGRQHRRWAPAARAATVCAMDPTRWSSPLLAGPSIPTASA